MHYDEEEALNNYVLQHYGHLMTQLESRVIKAIQAEEKATNSQDDLMRSLIRRRWVRLDDDQVVRRLKLGPARSDEAFASDFSGRREQKSPSTAVQIARGLSERRAPGNAPGAETTGTESRTRANGGTSGFTPWEHRRA